jgi:signal transduction histidine kinase
VLRTARPARIDDYTNATGAFAAFLRERGTRSAVGSPIVVQGRLWGVMVAASLGADPLPLGTEERMAHFTELVSTAIANGQARSELRLVADEQAALRRVATLVARQGSPAEVLAAVAEEVGTLLRVDGATILRFEADATATVVAGWGAPDMPGHVGRRLPVAGDDPVAHVLETRRPARQAERPDAAGPLAEIARDVDVLCSLATPIVVEGDLWGAIVVVTLSPSPLSDSTETRIEQFTELVGTAIANVKARAELSESRARIVRTADQTRRRFERDLHDGVQQRLVSLSLDLRGVEALLPPGLEVARAQLSRTVERLADALDDLRELSRGLHPAILSEGGLGPALRALGRRSPVPIKLDLEVGGGRLREPVEVAAYFVVSEALANVAKHARASIAEVRVVARDGVLELAIHDDGIGGADPGRGSGLTGLTDRVDALGGTLTIASSPQDGTRLRVTLPL